MTEMKECSLENRGQYYAQRLAEMIRCRTVSQKDGFEPEEFLKLREVLRELFPRMAEEAELTILGDDAYLYKLKGRDESRNVMVMSHHDVVDATGDWKEESFAGVIRDGRLWGRGTVDTKTPLFAEFSAIEELLREGFEFPVNTYLFSSHNEETGGDGAVLALDYFNRHQIRFDWIIDEGGAVIDPPMAGIHKKMRHDGSARKRALHRRSDRKKAAGTCRAGGKPQDARHADGGLYDCGGRKKAFSPQASPRGKGHV